MTIYKGTTFSQVFVWSENDLPVDLSSWEAKMQIKSASDTYTITSDTGGITLGDAGEIGLIFSSAFTSEMVAGSYKYDLLLRTDLGVIMPPIVSGMITVIQGVTSWM
jgi:hypothetical protein